MRIKPEVDQRGVHPRLWYVLGWLDRLHALYTGDELVVTSLRRPFEDSRRSRHAPLPPIGRGFLHPRQWDRFMVTAADLRRWSLDGTGGLTAVEFCKHIQGEHGDEIGVVLEPEWLSAEEIQKRGGIDAIAGHVHVQLKLPAKWTLFK